MQKNKRMIMLKNIRIVLINTSHPGNIGASARAMKTMGIKDLYLVEPRQFPHPKAYEMASNAQDVLDNAEVKPDVLSAIADCQFVIGTSARSRAIPWPVLDARQMAVTAAKEIAANHKVAILMGREDSGLTNEELQLCHVHVQIPANPDYSSLNLAAAVQVLCYELRMQSLTATPAPSWDYPLASAEDMEKMFAHLEQTLVMIDFLKPAAPRKLMTRLRRLLFRARPDVMEMNILRGMLTAIQQFKKQS